MRSFLKTLCFFLIGAVIFSPLLFAKEFRAKITGINLRQGFLVVQPVDDAASSGRAMIVMIAENTRYEGFNSTKELAIGDEVTFDATEALAGAWSLQTLKRSLPPGALPAEEVKTSGGGAAMAMGGYVGD
ncbi:MAG: hypothetical protein KTQ49_07535 [Candidatus Omnitrophica bacterium]|nr:hypothetical protein [Candidatus Omnitrophota bacterium]